MGKAFVQAYLPAQADFVFDDESKILGLLGGYGVGKTRAGNLKALRLGTLNAPYPGMVIEPTFDQIESVFLEGMWGILNDWNVPSRHIRYSSKNHNLDLKLNGKWFQIRCRSADRPEKLAGHNLAWAIIDEFDHISEKIASQVRARIRVRRAPCRQLCLVGTPERPGKWGQQWLELEPADGTRLVRARTSDNFFLPPDFVSMMLGHLSDQEKRQYLEGYWVNYSGTVYTRFRPDVHVRKCTDPEEGEHVMGVDFGVHCSAYVFGRVMGDQLHIFDEIILEQHDTFAGGAAALEKWQGLYNKWFGPHQQQVAESVKAYCDPAGGGAQRRSASDGRILNEIGFRTFARHKSIPIRERINAMQEKFRKHEILIDPSCRYMINCLQNQGYDKQGQPEKGTPRDGKKAHDHANDALGYLIEYRWPSALSKGNVFRYH